MSVAFSSPGGRVVATAARPGGSRARHSTHVMRGAQVRGARHGVVGLGRLGGMGGQARHAGASARRIQRKAGRGGVVAALMTEEEELALAEFPVKLGTLHEVHVPTQRECDEGATLDDYMTLPVSQFVLIDLPLGGELVRIEGSVFQLTVPAMKFFDVWIKPTVLVNVESRGDSVTLDAMECHITGSPFVEKLKINERVDIAVHTVFTWTGNDSEEGPAINSVTDIRVGVDPPGPFKAIPKRVLRATGNAVMRTTLKLLHSSFLQSLGRDYDKWALDGEYRHYRATLTDS